jgi:hypothetical protein
MNADSGQLGQPQSLCNHPKLDTHREIPDTSLSTAERRGEGQASAYI